ncbi:hypothetical protein NIES2104_14140 [Leptolyngbya sp. NIES-2104]|nr:hypothetical protein NIES2104_14140 [Leptolyngbya sp. NIES-2104]
MIDIVRNWLRLARVFEFRGFKLVVQAIVDHKIKTVVDRNIKTVVDRNVPPRNGIRG